MIVSGARRPVDAGIAPVGGRDSRAARPQRGRDERRVGIVGRKVRAGNETNVDRHGSGLMNAIGTVRPHLLVAERGDAAAGLHRVLDRAERVAEQHRARVEIGHGERETPEPLAAHVGDRSDQLDDDLAGAEERLRRAVPELAHAPQVRDRASS